MDATAHAPEPTPAVLAVTIVHGTFPRRLWLQLRRNLRALWSRLCGRQVDEAALWPAPSSKPDRRCWFEEGSEFERDLVRRAGLAPGSVIFNRFLWSGRNTFADRTEAALSLRAALRESACRHPGVPLVVLAHSHGGTVAVKALDTREGLRGGGETADVQALLTLGTPFVRLVWRWGRMPEGGFVELVATLLPRMLLALAPLMAFQLSWRSDGVAQAVAIVLLISALVAAWRVSIVAATTIIAIVLALGHRNPHEPWIILLIIMAGYVLMFLMRPAGNAGDAESRRILEEWVRSLSEAGKRHVEEEPLCLPCPLLALRAPRDEASLVIGLGQVVQGLGHAVAWFVDAAVRRLRLKPALALLVLVLVLLLVVGAAINLLGLLPLEWGDWLSWGFVGLLVGGYMGLLVLVTAMLAWALPTIGISLVTGREAFMLPVATLVEAEPLPNARASDGLRPAEMDLEIIYEARLTGLKHSLYDAPQVRDRIALWLREQAGAPAAGLCRTR